MRPSAFTMAASQSSCCPNFEWVFELDLGQANHFDLALGTCAKCGRSWISAFCEPSRMAGYEPVSPGDVQRLRSIRAGPELKAFMRKWTDENM
jgi:hypothetical protein